MPAGTLEGPSDSPGDSWIPSAPLKEERESPARVPPVVEYYYIGDDGRSLCAPLISSKDGEAVISFAEAHEVGLQRQLYSS